MFEFFSKRYALPEEVARLLRLLEQSGYEAYAVGGCVRDLLLGRTPKDWDLTTSAKPDEVAAVFRQAGYRVIPQVGEAFAVSVVQGVDDRYEVATFRGERYGADSHRPESIYYADSLLEDLSRRDFTVNAMALTSDGMLIDEYDGQTDIKKKRLRTVGAPEERFREDALRLFRACRFLAELDFMPTRSICDAMPAAFDRVKGLSFERVRVEVERILLAPSVARGLDLLVRSGLAATTCLKRMNGTPVGLPILPELMHLPTTEQGDFHCYDAWMHTLIVVQHTPATLVERWAALFHDVAKGMDGIRGQHNDRITDYGHDEKGAEIAFSVLKRWGYAPMLCKRVAFIVRSHMKYHFIAGNQEADAVRWVRKLARSGEFRRTSDLEEAMHQLGNVCIADVIGCGRPNSATDGHRAFFAYMDQCVREMPIHTRDLAYTADLVSICGNDTGRCLKMLLRRVQDGQLPNTAAALLQAAVKYKERIKESV